MPPCDPSKPSRVSLLQLGTEHAESLDASLAGELVQRGFRHAGEPLGAGNIDEIPFGVVLLFSIAHALVTIEDLLGRLTGEVSNIRRLLDSRPDSEVDEDADDDGYLDEEG